MNSTTFATPRSPPGPSAIFFFNDTATTEIYPLSLHDALPISTLAPLQEAAQAIVKSYDVGGLLQITYHAHHTRRPVRAYGTRPAHIEQTTDYQLRVRVQTAALARAIRRLGWRVYATNHPARPLPLQPALLPYLPPYPQQPPF